MNSNYCLILTVIKSSPWGCVPIPGCESSQSVLVICQRCSEEMVDNASDNKILGETAYVAAAPLPFPHEEQRRGHNCTSV